MAVPTGVDVEHGKCVVARVAVAGDWLGPSADLFLAAFRRTPTANAEGLDRVGG